MREPRLILVVDDDSHLCDLLQVTLEQAGFGVVIERDGGRALSRFRETDPALVVLDLALPGADGMELCLAIRRESAVPILVLSGQADEAVRVRALEAGADDYMVKPFSLRELVARIRAILRRAGEKAAERLEFPGLTIDMERHLVTVYREPVSLTPKEFDLLTTLALHPGRVFSRDDLLRDVWEYEYFLEGRTVDEHVRRLRSKIESRSQPYRYIQTVWSIGYKFEVTK